MEEYTETDAVRRELDTDTDSPGVEVAMSVADIEGRNATELSAIHDCIDGVLTNLFSTPPSPEAEMRVEFSYQGYRISVEQSGTATFREIS